MLARSRPPPRRAGGGRQNCCLTAPRDTGRKRGGMDKHRTDAPEASPGLRRPSSPHRLPLAQTCCVIPCRPDRSCSRLNRAGPIAATALSNRGGFFSPGAGAARTEKSMAFPLKRGICFFAGHAKAFLCVASDATLLDEPRCLRARHRSDLPRNRGPIVLMRRQNGARPASYCRRRP